MSEKPLIVLSLAYVLVVWTLGALGRDLLFNHNVDADLADDKIGAILPYIRVTACGFAALALTAITGIGWTLRRLPLALAPFVLWTLASVLWTDSGKDTLRASLTLIAAWTVAPALIYRLGLARSARLLLLVIAVVCVASFLVAVFMPSVGRHSAGDLVQGAHDGRWRGIFSHKNGLGPWAAYGSALLPLYGGLGVPRPLRAVAALCGLACLVFCGSATAVAVAALCVLLYGVFAAMRRWRAGVAIAIAVALILAGTLLVTLNAGRLFEALGRSADASGRWAIWNLAWEYVVDTPWIGHGFATLGGPDFRGREASLFQQAIAGPESGYLAVLQEIGIVGGGLFLAGYVVGVVKGFAWLARATPQDRRALEFYLTILLTTLAEGYSETHAFVLTGFSGVISFSALFALGTAPWPSCTARRSFRHISAQRLQRDVRNFSVGEKSDRVSENIGDLAHRRSA